jgi:hypothetical protein
MNGRILEGAGEGHTLESLMKDWKGWAANKENCEAYFSSGSQIVYRDNNIGSVLTAWVEDPRDAVSFQVLEMG